MELEAKLEKKSIKKGSRAKNHLLLKLKTPPPPSIVNRQPLVIGLAVDKSWSMKGEKMESTIEAASALINWLTRHDYISIIAYSADVQIVQSVVQLKDKSAIIDKLHSLEVATSTNLSGGWLQALRAVEASDVPNSYKRVILLTDGQATMGIKDPEQFSKIASDHFARGISTTTIGFGDDFNESSLRDIALAGGGNFYYIQSPEQTNEIFFKEFGDIGALYGQALELKLKTVPGVKIIELLNDLPHQKVGSDVLTIQPGDIRSDDIRNLVLNVEVDSSLNSDLDQEGVCTVELSYYNLFENMKFDKLKTVVLLGFADMDSEVDNEVVLERILATAARTMIRASALIQQGETNHARDMLVQMIGKVDENQSIAPDILKPLLSRLRIMEHKLKDNTSNASKQFLAAGTEIYSRTDMIDLMGVEVHDSIFEFQTAGDIDLYKCPDIKNTVQNQMNDGYRFMIFDLNNTRHIDSSGIGTFIQIVGWLRRRGGEFVVTNISDGVRKIFSLTRLENHIRVTDSIQEARNTIQNIIDTRQKD
ncbi:MAG: anti-sigma factor antagonist [Spirochaetota bacterium]